MEKNETRIRSGKPAGLISSQPNVLRNLRRVVRSLLSLEIPGQLLEVVPAIKRSMHRLEEQAWVFHSRCTADRRPVHFDISQKRVDVLSKTNNRFAQSHFRWGDRMNQSMWKESGHVFLWLANRLALSVNRRVWGRQKIQSGDMPF